MSKFLNLFFFALCSIIFLSSCQEQVVDPLSRGTINKGVVQWAAGSGNYELEPGEMRIFTHYAQRKEDGSVNGNFMLNNKLTDIHISGKIIGFTIIGNEAYFGGVIEQSNYNNPAFPLLWQPGTCVYFSTADNGEGNPSPDIISLTFNGVGSTPFTIEDVLGFCDDPTTCPWYYYPKSFVQEGNIQIVQ